MESNSYKFSQLFQWLQFICTKQMHEFIFYSCFYSAISKFLIGKMSLRNKFENRFSKLKTGFRFSNRKPDFGFLINIPNPRRVLHPANLENSFKNHYSELFRLQNLKCLVFRE